MNGKKNFAVVFLGVLILLAAIFAVSYSWFSADVINPIGSSIITEAADLGNIIFHDGNQISITNSYPGDIITKSFTVARNGSFDEDAAPAMNYQIILNITNNTLTDVSDGTFQYSLVGETSNNGRPVSKQNVAVPLTTSTLGVGTLNGTDIHTYTFSIGVIESGSDQRSTMGKEFSGYLQVESIDQIEDATTLEKGYKLLTGNLLTNPAFTEGTYTTLDWDKTLNPDPAFGPSRWTNGYRSDLAGANVGYHAYYDDSEFGYMVLNFKNLNSAYGYTNRWLGTAQSLSAGKVKPNTKYVVAMDIYADTAGTRVYGGVYNKNNGGFSNVYYNFYSASAELNKWVRKRQIITTASVVDTSLAYSFYIYGYGGSEGTTYVKNVFIAEVE